jgi:hypothetical protein
MGDGAGLTLLGETIAATIAAPGAPCTRSRRTRGARRRARAARRGDARGVETGSPQEALANATPYLQAFGHVTVAWIWLDVAICAAALGRRRDAARPARRVPLLLPLRAAEDRRLARRRREPRRHLPDDGRGLVLKLAPAASRACLGPDLRRPVVFVVGVALSRGGPRLRLERLGRRHRRRGRGRGARLRPLAHGRSPDA